MTARDFSRSLLTWAVRGRGEHGTDWGEGMLGELDHIHGRWARLRWATSAARVARRDRLRQLPSSAPLGRLPKTWRVTARATLSLALAAGALAVVDSYVLTLRNEPSASMAPTIETGEHYLVDRVIFHLTGVSYGNVVVLSVSPPVGQRYELVKRIVGLGGDTMSCVDGRLLRNGTVVDEPYLPQGTVTDCATTTVAPDQVFVLGDNRSVSYDSRQLGPLPATSIVGRAIR